MKFDTKDEFEAQRAKMAFIFLFFSTIVTIGFMYDFYQKYLIPMPSWIYSIFFIIIFIIYFVLRTQKKYHIIFFDDEEEPNVITIKFSPLSSLSGKSRMIKIPKNSLYKFEIEKKFYNLRKELVLYQNTKKGIAKYPGIPINLLSNEKLNLLIETLNKYAQIKFNYSLKK